MKITLRAAVAQRLSAFLLISGLTVTLLGVIAPEPAHAALAGHRWKTGTVCVVDKTGNRWPVYSATRRWTRVPDLSFRYASWCKQKVYIYERWSSRYEYGYALPYVWSDNTIAYCKIWMNNTYGRRLSWADRRSAIMHELGHCSGIDHTSYSKSLMNTKRWRYYDYPTWYDKREVDRRHPW